VSDDEQQDSDLPQRPRARGDCAGGARPCPYVSCRHHLYLDVPRGGSGFRLTHPDLEPWELEETCSLDVADRGGGTLEDVAAVMSVTRERIRQIEELALRRLRPIANRALSDDLPAPRRAAPVVAPVRRLPVLAPPRPRPALIEAPRAEPVAPPVAPVEVEGAREAPPAPVAEPEPVSAPLLPAPPAAVEPPARPVVRRQVFGTIDAIPPAPPEPPPTGLTPAEIQAARIARMRPLRPPTRKPAGDDAWPLRERA
jgi:hypothetical protein